MYNNCYALNSDNLAFSEKILFISNFKEFVYSGAGKRPELAITRNFKESEGLKAIIGGADDTWLTSELQRILEAIYRYTVEANNRDPDFSQHKYWVQGESWQIKKDNHERFNPETSVFDLDYIDQYGLRRKIWEDEIIMSKDCLKLNGKILPIRNFRAYVALSAFGFKDPHLFFTKGSNLNTGLNSSNGQTP